VKERKKTGTTKGLISTNPNPLTDTNESGEDTVKVKKSESKKKLKSKDISPETKKDSSESSKKSKGKDRKSKTISKAEIDKTRKNKGEEDPDEALEKVLEISRKEFVDEEKKKRSRF